MRRCKESTQKRTQQGQYLYKIDFLKKSLICFSGYEFQLKNCAKSSNSKISTINQMSYIESFLSKHIFSHILTVLKDPKDHQSFLNHRSDSNLFSLNWQILLFAESSCRSSDRQWLSSEISQNLLISFEQLKSTQLSAREDDSDLIKTIKIDFQYVYILMHQVMIRIILGYLEISHYERMTQKAKSFVNQISFIYPALKTQISINETNINLTDWLQYYISKIIIEKQPNEAFYDFLDLIKEQSHFIGAMERLFNKFQQNRVSENNALYSRDFDASVCGQSRSQSIISRFSQTKGFSDLEVLRKKKKIMKDRVRFQKMSFDNTTNTSVKVRQQRCTPFTEEMTQNYKNYKTQAVASNNTNFDISKLLRKPKKPIQRTIYHSSNKTFVAKKPSGMNCLNPQEYIQNLTATSSLTSNQSLSFYDTCKRFSSSFAKSTADVEENCQFHVPETPKQQAFRKKSIQGNRYVLDVKSFIPKLRL